LLEQGPWEKTLFLRAIGKKIQQIRDGYAVYLDQLSPSSKASASQQSTHELLEDAINIYIVLYNAEGHDLAKWETVIANLESNVISRPIYAREEEAAAFVRSKMNPRNQGYVIAQVSSAAIVKQDPKRVVRDRLNHMLLAIRAGYLQANSVRQFVHATGTYQWHNHTLQLIQAPQLP
jgi:intracellular multiplication protein IcmQ